MNFITITQRTPHCNDRIVVQKLYFYGKSTVLVGPSHFYKNVDTNGKCHCFCIIRAYHHSSNTSPILARSYYTLPVKCALLRIYIYISDPTTVSFVLPLNPAPYPPSHLPQDTSFTSLYSKRANVKTSKATYYVTIDLRLSFIPNETL